MSKLIVKWRYIKPGQSKYSEHMVKYIATREGVEKCDESWKYEQATREQQRLISDILKDYPSTKQTSEYQDYLDNPTKYTASKLISIGIDENVDLIAQKENYVEYIAKRPRVEKQGTHGLFSQKDQVIDLDKVAKEIAEHNGVIWTTIISLKREDAERLGYDTANGWKEMLRGNTQALADAMGIPVEDLKWYAAFHNEGHHPHVHLVSYSKGKEPYMFEEGLKILKSKYANEIFKCDLYQSREEITKYRDELREYAKKRAREIIEQINNGDYQDELVQQLLLSLKKELKDYSGKKVYGYIPKSAKNLVDGIIDQLSYDERIKELYDLWYEQKESVLKTYQDNMPDRVPLSQNKEFKPIKNAVLKELDNLVVEKEEVKEEKKESTKKENTENKTEYDTSQLTLSAGVGALRLFRHLGRLIQNKIDSDNKGGRLIDKKQRRQINEKKQAQGIKLE